MLFSFARQRATMGPPFALLAPACRALRAIGDVLPSHFPPPSLGGRRNVRAQASGATAPLYHLREERSQGDYNRGGVCETVDRFVREVEDGLKSMLGPCLFLEMEKIPREGLPRCLDLNQNPRLAVADDRKIHLALELVAEVVEFETPEAEVGPSLDRLEQMTGRECLGPRAGIRDCRPVAQIPLRLFAERFRDIFNLTSLLLDRRGP